MSNIGKLERTRNLILDAAWSLISEKGAEVSMSEIAAAAGVTRQSVYVHFGTRGGMLMALVKRADERFRIRELMFESFEIADPRARLDATIVVWLDFVVKIYPVASDLVRLRQTDEDAASAWEDRMSDLRSWLNVLVRSLAKDDALSAEWRTEDAAEYLWAAFSVQTWGLLVHDCGWEIEKTRETLRRTIPLALFGTAHRC